MEIRHPYLVIVRDRLLKMYTALAKSLCTKQLPGFGTTQKNERQEGNIHAQFHNFVLTSDGKSGIVPVWFIVYQYYEITADYKAEAKAQILGPKAMQAIKPVSMTEVVQQLAAFQFDHKNARYTDQNDKRSNRVGEAIMEIRQTLLDLNKYCVGQVYHINPDTEEPDDRIVMVDLFLRDEADIDESGAYKSKIKLILASPEFVSDSMPA